ncbi:GntR family transcriptional regulator [Bizionia gelidisalsuginis]|uniref:GntR family transcriptional regulator n=1 Tax=Bizionia gelidisalsuginis TaxID=291188 RepID=A0ABY3MBZ6_9FLAO|nr:S1-like domain-containing RNA-binding protein [Bizionia gelidisalsuginis]TYC14849.1 GntR family transcriptional regulator [Bizionia gelidisalsuginis]
MIQVGKYNTLEILRDTEPGLFLGDEDDNEVLLPNRYVPETFELGDTLEVFIYLDNNERLVAVTDRPYILRDQYAVLRCNAVTPHGAFLDWGMVKELFCPFKEQAFPMKKGGWYLVHCYLDEKTERLAASSKTNRFLDNTELTVAEFDEVDLIVSHPSDIGMNVIVNNKHTGLIYKDNIYKELSIGDNIKGIVKKIRPGNKIDIALGQIGYRNIEPNAQRVVEELQNNSGFIALTDKSTPEAIKDVLQMSKKNFKKAVGSLYKEKTITIKPDGIYLNENQS